MAGIREQSIFSDSQLLEAYAASTSQEVFAELVRRHADLVYAAARRQVRDPHLAEDVTQAVFLLLTQKARRVRGPLAGWLIKATWYVARNAKRLALIRQRHERKVAEMNSRQSETCPVEPSDGYSQYLDGAIAKLSTTDRAAISLRFLKGLELSEVAQEMGISPEAARKRIERSVMKLRGVLSARTPVPAAGALGAQLAAITFETAPAELVQAIASAGGKAANGALSSALASGASKAMAWAGVKVAALVVLATSLAALGAGLVVQLGVGRSATPAAAAAPAPVPAGTEAKMPGEMQLAIWDVLLNESGARLIEGLGRPVQNASRVYQPRICLGEELRSAVAKAMDTGGIARVSHRMQFVDFTRGKENYWGIIPQLVFDYPNDDNAKPFSFRGSSDKIVADDFVHLDADHLMVKLNHPDIYAGPREGVYENLQVPPGQAIVYDGQLAAGEALAFLARIPARQAGAYYHLVVWETFKAPPTQIGMISQQRDSGWWCRNGLQTLRAWADVARVWMPSANDPRNWPNTLVRKLSDGNSVSLIAMSRPSKWPFCWWDAKGMPTFAEGPIPLDGNPPDGLWALLQVSLPPGKSPYPWQRRPSDPPCVYGSPCQRIAETGPIEVGIPVGGWDEIARTKLGETVVAENVSFKVEESSSESFVRLTMTGVLNDQYLLTVIGKSGKENKPIFDSTDIKWGRDTRPGTVTVSMDAYPIAPQDREMFIVMRQKRQWVSFDDFATNPTSPPPTAVAAGEADQKEADSKRQWDELLRRNRLAAAKAGREAFKAMDTGAGTPGEMLRTLDRAIHAGDAAAVRQMLSSSKPRMDEVLEQMARGLVVSESVRARAVTLFGIDAVDGDLCMPEFIPMLAGWNWTKSPDGSYHHGGEMFVLRPRPDGRFLLELQFAGGKDEINGIDTMLTQLEALDKLLARNPPPTLQEANAVMTPKPGR